MKKKLNELNSSTATTLETLQSMRGSWGDVKPVTRVIPDKRNAKRKHEKEKERRNYEDD